MKIEIAMVPALRNAHTASTETSNGHREHTKKVRDNMIKTCEFCGKKFEASRKDRRYCSRKCLNQKMISHRREEAAAVDREWKKEKPCKICGKLFMPRIANQLCCSSACSEENAKITTRTNYWESKKTKEVKEKKQREQKQKKLSIAEINKRAREEHMSYGQYCGKYGL